MPLFAIPYPVIDPIAFEIGPLAVRWYGLAYMAGILLGWLYGRYLLSRRDGRVPAQPATELPPAKPSLQRSKLLVKSNHRNFIVDAQDVVYATIDDGLITVASPGSGASSGREIYVGVPRSDLESGIQLARRRCNWPAGEES
jgi:hypothetical protein